MRSKYSCLQITCEECEWSRLCQIYDLTSSKENVF